MKAWHHGGASHPIDVCRPSPRSRAFFSTNVPTQHTKRSNCTCKTWSIHLNSFKHWVSQILSQSKYNVTWSKSPYSQKEFLDLRWRFSLFLATKNHSKRWMLNVSDLRPRPRYHRGQAAPRRVSAWPLALVPRRPRHPRSWKGSTHTIVNYMLFTSIGWSVRW